MNQMTDRDLLVKVHTEVQGISKGIDVLTGDVKGLLTKVVLAICGLAGASLGLKFIGSPFLTVVGLYVSWFGLFFLPASVIIWWKRLPWEYRIVRILLMAFIGLKVITQTFVYESGVEIAPQWFAPAADFLIGLVVFMMILAVWRNR